MSVASFPAIMWGLGKGIDFVEFQRNCLSPTSSANKTFGPPGCRSANLERLYTFESMTIHCISKHSDINMFLELDSVPYKIAFFFMLIVKLSVSTLLLLIE